MAGVPLPSNTKKGNLLSILSIHKLTSKVRLEEGGIESIVPYGKQAAPANTADEKLVGKVTQQGGKGPVKYEHIHVWEDK